MNVWFSGYLLLGVLVYLALWIWAAMRGREDSSDQFFIGATDVFYLIVWPLVLPFLIKDMIAEPGRNTSKPEVRVELDPMTGATGVAKNDLRPCGIIAVNGREFDAVATAGLIDKGTVVMIVDRDGLHCRVRALDRSTNPKRTQVTDD